jgi:hypothetical protein
MFCVPFNNLTDVAVLMESAQGFLRRVNYSKALLGRGTAPRIWTFPHPVVSDTEGFDPQLFFLYWSCTFIRPVLEYACQVWHSSLSSTLSDQIEHVQKRAIKIMFPHLSYTASLEQSRLSTLHERRENQYLSLYKSVLNHDNKLHELLPDPVYHKNQG